MRILKWGAFVILIYAIAALFYRQPQHAKWDGQQFSCPAGTDQWVDETAARAGKQNFVYCVK